MLIKFNLIKTENMKQRILSLTLSTLSLLFVQRVMAYDFEVNGIFYNLDSYYLTAIVTSGEMPYKGIVIIPDSVTYKGKTMAVKLIGESAFANCADLTSIQFGKCVNTIDDYAFKDCTKLTRLIIPSTISRIENGAFFGCKNLKELTFEDSEKMLGIGTNGGSAPSAAFDCKLEYLYLGRYFDEAFNLDCSNLKTLLIGKNITWLSGFTGAQITKLVIPANVLYIGDGAFRECTKLESVIIEDGDKEMHCRKAYYRTSGNGGGLYNWGAFCDSPLKECYIGRPINLTPDNSNALAGPFNDSQVQKITISQSLSSVCDIYRCPNLKEIDIPASVKEIIGFNGCSSIITIKCRATTPPNVKGYNPFENNTYLNATLYVPKGSVDSYKSDQIWGKFFDVQEANDSPNAKQKCDTPIITYENKMICFNCNTPNVIFHHTITSPDMTTGINDGMIRLSALYKISAYASRADYDNSDETIAYLYWTEADLESSDIQAVRANSRGIIIQSDNGFLTISGLDNNENVSVYTTEGILIGNGKSVSGSAIFNLNSTNKIVIVKIGKESIKIVL